MCHTRLFFKLYHKEAFDSIKTPFSLNLIAFCNFHPQISYFKINLYYLFILICDFFWNICLFLNVFFIQMFGYV